MAEVIIAHEGAVAIVTLNRPRAMNALSKSLRRQLAEALIELDADAGVSVIVLTGAGERAFSAGLDLKELGAEADALGAGAAASQEKDPVAAIEACRKPVIAAINGYAITGGFEIALACDVLIASTNARFGDTHGRVGVMPGWGLSQKLPRLIGPYRAKELSLSGRFLDADEARDWGLVNRVVAPQDLMPTALALAQEMAEVDASMLSALKGVIDAGYALSLSEGLKLERERARAHNVSLTPRDIEARRAGVQARGRKLGEND